MYKVIIEVNSKEHKGDGKTIPEAIDDTGLSFTDIKTNGFITLIKCGKDKRYKSYEIRKYFLARQMKKLFNVSLVRKFWPRDMMSMFEIMKEKKLFKKEIML